MNFRFYCSCGMCNYTKPPCIIDSDCIKLEEKNRSRERRSCLPDHLWTRTDEWHWSIFVCYFEYGYVSQSDGNGRWILCADRLSILILLHMREKWIGRLWMQEHCFMWTWKRYHGSILPTQHLHIVQRREDTIYGSLLDDPFEYEKSKY